MLALHHAPAVVSAAVIAGGLAVDLLVAALADVGDEQGAGGAVEGDPPRVAQAPGPDLVPARDRAPERIGRRDAVAAVRTGAGPVDVDAQDLGEQVLGLALGVAILIVRPAPVASSQVQQAVRSEGHRAAVVVRCGAVIDGEDVLAGLVADGRSGVIRQVAGDHDVAVVARVVHEQPVVGLEARVEGETEQALLTAAVPDERADVHEEAGLHRAAIDDTDRATPLDGEQAPTRVARVGDLGQLEEGMAGHERQRDRECRRACRGQGPGERKQEDHETDDDGRATPAGSWVCHDLTVQRHANPDTQTMRGGHPRYGSEPAAQVARHRAAQDRRGRAEESGPRSVG